MNLKATFKIAILFFTIVNLSFTTNNDNIIGTWSYEVTNSQDGYDKGQLIFSQVDGQWKGIVKVDYDKFTVKDLKVNKEKVSFKVNVEGYNIDVVLKLKENTFTGKASFSEGVLDLKGKKIKI
ncbi:hypothetical protein [Membranihabitans marinus]|uniref:hypothetical protein n=1 Tax=Membranihabitans marinus TaxID=1227546 RepID=UPI001F27F22A|nr:hypothetical protein [Membranihabitans marinus]